MSRKTTHRRGTPRALAAALLGGLVLAAPMTAQAATPKLTASVGPGFTISLKNAAGKKVTSLKAGTYRISVRDRSADHDFRLRGPGVNKVLSSVAATGMKTVTVRLKAGRYTFVCQPHAPAMRGSFRVS
jgi:plastocyanin